jgi:pyruvate carboxylase
MLHLASASRGADCVRLQVISCAPTYEEALSKLHRALDEFLVRGVKTNIGFVLNVLTHPEFAAGKATTSFIERNAAQLFRVSDEGLMGQKLMNYLSEMVVNGPNHPGAIGAPSSRNVPVVPQFPELDGTPLTGWKDVLREKGPEGWAKDVRAHNGLLITDTTMRDAHQSLLATRMRTYDLLRAAEPTAQVPPSSCLHLSAHPWQRPWPSLVIDVAHVPCAAVPRCSSTRLRRARANGAAVATGARAAGVAGDVGRCHV